MFISRFPSLDGFYILEPTQVRQAVHKTIARLMAWSMEVASSGVGPDTGFAGEPLAKTSRGHLCGQQLGCGWRRSFKLKSSHQRFPKCMVGWLVGWGRIFTSCFPLWVNVAGLAFLLSKQI